MDLPRKRKELRLISSLRGITQIVVVDYNTRHIEDDDTIKITRYGLNDSIRHHLIHIKDYKSKFQKENNSYRTGKSQKIFGSSKTNDVDEFVSLLLIKLTNNQTFKFDNEGIDITEKLLEGNPTAGFDIDLYDYCENIVYEFLKTKSNKVTNASAHPMKYCWTFKKGDDRQKFISLNDFCRTIHAQLILVFYSMSTKDETRIDSNYLKVITDVNIDKNKGFKSDKEYLLTKDNFERYLLSDDDGKKKVLRADDLPSLYLTKHDFDNKNVYKAKLKKLNTEIVDYKKSK